MKFQAYFLLFLCLFFLYWDPNSAATNTLTLTGEFTFDKRVPEVALIYFTEDKDLSVEVEPVIDQVDKVFAPLLVVGAKGARVMIKNSDPMNHNVYALDRKLKVNFDTGLTNPGSVIYKEIDWEENNVVKIGCKIHPKMRAWIACIASRYYKVVPFDRKQKSAKFELKEVPDQYAKVTIWIPRYEPTEVTLAKEEPKTVELKRGKRVSGTLTLELK